MAGFVKDLRHGVSSLARSPLFTLTAVGTLALAIGANAHVFSAVNTYLYDFLPHPDSHELCDINGRTETFDATSISYLDFLDWREQNDVFEEMAAWDHVGFNLTGGDEPQRVTAISSTGALFEVFRAEAALGRTFTLEDDRPGAERVAVLAHRLWSESFDADPAIVGEKLELDGESYTVIGVMPESFWFQDGDEGLWIPMQLDPAEQSRGSHYMEAVARLRPGVTMDGARAAMDTLARRLETQYPETNEGRRVRVRPMIDDVVATEMRISILSLWGAVFFVLLIACANVANLMLTRATVRQREFAIRSALGAGPWRLARQLLSESLLLSLAGAGIGYLLALWAIDLTKASTPGDIPLLAAVEVDGTVFLFVVGLAVVTALVFGLAPIAQVLRTDLVSIIKNGEGRSGTSRGRKRLRNALAVAQVALALVLLASAGVMTKSISRILGTPPGFDLERIATGRVSLSETTHGEDHEKVDFYEAVLDRCAAIPGVSAVGVVMVVPPSGSNWVSDFALEGAPVDDLPFDERPWANLQVVGGSYFEAMGIPLVSGRTFHEGDTAEVDRVALVNRTAVERYWNDEDPIGRRFQMGENDEGEPIWHTIVGVVSDIHQGGVTAMIRPEVYRTHRQVPLNTMSIVLRTDGAPSTLLQPLQSAVRDVDPALAVYGLERLERVRMRRVWGELLTSRLMSVFAGVALLLAMVGVYGVVAYSASNRTQELGVRMSVGASPRDVVRLIMRQGLVVAILGLVIGVVGALGMTRALASLLHQVSPTDPVTFVTVSLVLLATTLLASWLPARRAAQLHPMEALRHE